MALEDHCCVGVSPRFNAWTGRIDLGGRSEKAAHIYRSDIPGMNVWNCVSLCNCAISVTGLLEPL